MKVYNNFNELPGAVGSEVGANTSFQSLADRQTDSPNTLFPSSSAELTWNEFLQNMATVHTFEGIKFEAGTEDPDKRKHLHVKLPNGAKTKFWIEKNYKKDIEHVPSSTSGDFNVDLNTIKEQIEVYYDEILKNYDLALKQKPFQVTRGKKTKGSNSPKAVAAKKAAKASQTDTSGQSY